MELRSPIMVLAIGLQGSCCLCCESELVLRHVTVDSRPVPYGSAKGVHGKAKVECNQ